MSSGKTEFDKFDAAMDTILKADPAQVKAEMEADKKQRAEGRSKRIKKPPKINHVESALVAFKKAAKAMKDDPKLQVPY
jgi:hypothetical protein